MTSPLDELKQKDDHTVTWMGHTVTREYIARLHYEGLNPWLTVFLRTEVPARKEYND